MFGFPKDQDMVTLPSSQPSFPMLSTQFWHISHRDVLMQTHPTVGNFKREPQAQQD